MKIFLAGNFPQMYKPETEKEVMLSVLKSVGHYNRLVSYFYLEPWTANVIKAIKDFRNESKA